MARKNLDTIKHIEITMENGRSMVSSMQIAKHFGKAHDNVLRDIRNLQADLPDNWFRLNFEDTEESVVVPASGGIRKDPSYLITRDAFALLAMGFTGKKALEWKIKYIEAFNKMEAALANQLQRKNKRIENKLAALIEGNQKRENMLKRLEDGLASMKECEYSEKDDFSGRTLAIIEGLLTYWAYLDEIDIEIARGVLFISVGINNTNEIIENWDKCRIFLQKMIHKPLRGSGGDKATEKQYEIMLALVEACNGFKWEKGNDNLESFLGAYGNRLEDFDSLSVRGANRYIHLLYAFFQSILHRTIRFSDLNNQLGYIYSNLK